MHNPPQLTALCIAPGTEDELLNLLMQFDKQDYPAGLRELVIIDEGPQDLQEVLNIFHGNAEDIHHVQYRHSTQRLFVEEKIQLALSVASGEYVHFMAVNTDYPADWFSRMQAKFQHTASGILSSRAEVLWLSPLSRLYTRETHLPTWSVLSQLCCQRSVLETRSLLLASNGWEVSFACEFTEHNEDVVPVIQCQTIEDITSRGLLVNTRALNLPLPAYSAPAVSLDWSFFEKIACISRFQLPQQRDDFRTGMARQLRVAEQEIHIISSQIIQVASVRRLSAQLEALKTARDRQWNNILILDEGIQFVNQDSRSHAANQALAALKGKPWHVLVLSAQYQDIRSLDRTPDIVSIQHATAIGAYAVNSSYYNTLIDFFEKQLVEYNRNANNKVSYPDSYWNLLQPKDSWFGLWPVLAFPMPELDENQTVTTDSLHLYFKPRLAIDNVARSQREAPLLDLVKQHQATPKTYHELAALNRELQRDELAGYYDFKAMGRLPKVKQDTSWPLLSVIIPTYNQVDYLKETLESIFLQSYPNMEIIVADDCSTDGTQTYMEMVADVRVKYVKNQINLQVDRNISEAVFNHSQGNYICTVGHDDLVIDCHYYWNVVQILENNKNLALVFANHYEWHYKDNIFVVSTPIQRTAKFAGKDYFLKYNTFGYKFILPSVTIYRKNYLIQSREHIKNISKLNNAELDKYNKAEDTIAYLRLMLFGDVFSFSSFSVVYRVHSYSISNVVTEVEKEIYYLKDFTDNLSKTMSIAISKGIYNDVLSHWFSRIVINNFINWRIRSYIDRGEGSVFLLPILAWLNKYYPEIGRSVLKMYLIK